MSDLYIALTWISSNAWWLVLAITCGYAVAHYEASKEIADLHAQLDSAERAEDAASRRD